MKKFIHISLFLLALFLLFSVKHTTATNNVSTALALLKCKLLSLAQSLSPKQIFEEIPEAPQKQVDTKQEKENLKKEYELIAQEEEKNKPECNYFKKFAILLDRYNAESAVMDIFAENSIAIQYTLALCLQANKNNTPIDVPIIVSSNTIKSIIERKKNINKDLQGYSKCEWFKKPLLNISLDQKTLLFFHINSTDYYLCIPKSAPEKIIIHLKNNLNLVNLSEHLPANYTESSASSSDNQFDKILNKINTEKNTDLVAALNLLFNDKFVKNFLTPKYIYLIGHGKPGIIGDLYTNTDEVFLFLKYLSEKINPTALFIASCFIGGDNQKYIVSLADKAEKIFIRPYNYTIILGGSDESSIYAGTDFSTFFDIFEKFSNSENDFVKFLKHTTITRGFVNIDNIPLILFKMGTRFISKNIKNIVKVIGRTTTEAFEKESKTKKEEIRTIAGVDAFIVYPTYCTIPLKIKPQNPLAFTMLLPFDAKEAIKNYKTFFNLFPSLTDKKNENNSEYPVFPTFIPQNNSVNSYYFKSIEIEEKDDSLHGVLCCLRDTFLNVSANRALRNVYIEKITGPNDLYDILDSSSQLKNNIQNQNKKNGKISLSNIIITSEYIEKAKDHLSATISFAYPDENTRWSFSTKKTNAKPWDFEKLEGNALIQEKEKYTQETLNISGLKEIFMETGKKIIGNTFGVIDYSKIAPLIDIDFYIDLARPETKKFSIQDKENLPTLFKNITTSPLEDEKIINYYSNTINIIVNSIFFQTLIPNESLETIYMLLGGDMKEDKCNELKKVFYLFEKRLPDEKTIKALNIEKNIITKTNKKKIQKHINEIKEKIMIEKNENELKKLKKSQEDLESFIKNPQKNIDDDIQNLQKRSKNLLKNIAFQFFIDTKKEKKQDLFTKELSYEALADVYKNIFNKYYFALIVNRDPRKNIESRDSDTNRQDNNLKLGPSILNYENFKTMCILQEKALIRSENGYYGVNIEKKLSNGPLFLCEQTNQDEGQIYLIMGIKKIILEVINNYTFVTKKEYKTYRAQSLSSYQLMPFTLFIPNLTGKNDINVLCELYRIKESKEKIETQWDAEKETMNNDDLELKNVLVECTGLNNVIENTIAHMNISIVFSFKNKTFILKTDDKKLSFEEIKDKNIKEKWDNEVTQCKKKLKLTS